MEIGAHVWLRQEDSHWGWVPALVVKKEPVTIRKVELINLTLTQDSMSEIAGEQLPFQVVVTVDPEQLKTADHDDIKIRNLPASFHWSGQDVEAHVLASPAVHNDSEIVGGVDDLIGLTHLHEPAILHALRLRYDADIIYTSTGPILIAVNPFKSMKYLYSNQTMEEYCAQGELVTSNTTTNTPFKNHRMHVGQQQQQKKLPPHVYQTGDDAYRAMIRGLENKELMRNPKQSMQRGKSPIALGPKDAPTNQSILVSGESGAGKTVTTKIVLNYFAMLSKRRSKIANSPASPHIEQVSIESQVLQSNPILESFGNARTIRNDNSSRFGKYIDIRFTRTGKLSGASIETYLLEKVRLIHPGTNERNYHVFYQFLAAATPRERNQFFVGNMRPQDFKLLSQSGTYGRRDYVSDESNHKEMLDAMVRDYLSLWLSGKQWFGY
jgi:myosin-5